MSMTESRSHGRSGPIAGPGVGRHLLIVDDDDRIRELLKEFLAREGYRLIAVAASDPTRSSTADITAPSGLVLLGWIGSITSKKGSEDPKFAAEMEVRSLTGHGAEKAIHH